jgi:protein involved in polysaccharide export with SLBB domain
MGLSKSPRPNRENRPYEPPVKATRILAILALFTASPLAAQSGNQEAAAATLAPGDLLRITVWRHPEYSGDFLVAPDGSVTHPLYREVNVAGIPLQVVEERVRTFLARYETNPAFVLSPLLRVFVGGEVRQPSVYTVSPGTTVAEVIALAGGPTDRGRLDHVRLIRRQSEETLDLTRLDTRATTLEARSGDQLLVDRRRNFFLDILAPSSSVFAAAASVASIIIQLSK